MRGADLVVRTLAAAGVERVFSLSGNQIMPLYDACIDAGIAIVHVRHEAAAVFMADAWAQLTGQVGVALVTAAPGAANAVGPLFSARAAESPVLLLTGDSALAEDGRGAFQELAQVPMTAPLTKLSLRAGRVDGLGGDVARAVRAALSGRPGPVHLALPADLLEAGTDAAPPAAETLAAEPCPAEPGQLAAIADAIGRAERPLVLTGPALNETRAGPLLARLAEALDAPVVPMQSPRGLKDPALGDIAGVLGRADLVVSLGKPVDFTLGFGRTGVFDPACRWIVLDAEAAERERARRNLGDRLALAVAAEPRSAAEALAAAGTGGPGRAGWRALVAERIGLRTEAAPSKAGRITPALLCAAVQRQVEAAPHSVVICDGGEFGQWAQAGVRGGAGIINGPSGAIGGAPCYALAAKLARPDAAVFALMGDGTIGFHLAEFETAARAGAPFVAVVGNDRRWNAEHQIQLRRYGPDRLIGCDLGDARYDLAVQALGGHGEHVTDAAGLEPALARAAACGKPACVNVEIEGLPAPAGPGH